MTNNIGAMAARLQFTTYELAQLPDHVYNDATALNVLAEGLTNADGYNMQDLEDNIYELDEEVNGLRSDLDYANDKIDDMETDLHDAEYILYKLLTQGFTCNKEEAWEVLEQMQFGDKGKPIVYDNGGKTLDRYTIMGSKYANSGVSASETGGGVYQHTECKAGPHLGKEVNFYKLDRELQKKYLNQYKKHRY